MTKINVQRDYRMRAYKTRSWLPWRKYRWEVFLKTSFYVETGHGYPIEEYEEKVREGYAYGPDQAVDRADKARDQYEVVVKTVDEAFETLLFLKDDES